MRKILTKDHLFLSIVFGVCFVLIYNSSDYCFFWDTVSIVSKQAHFLYENNFSSYLYPVAFDNADPQLLQSYIALMWTLFGRSIQVAHIAILPILLGIVYLVFMISKKFFNKKASFFITLILLSEPSIITQGIIMSQDILLFFFALLTIYGIIYKKNFVISIGLLLLTLVNRRAMMLSAGFMLSIIINELIVNRDRFDLVYIRRKALTFLPAVISVGAYLLIRLYYFGWFFSHPESPWYTTSSFVNLNSFLKNFATIGRSFLDNGRVIWWVFLLILAIKIKVKGLFHKKIVPYWILFFSLLIVLLPPTLLIQNEFGSRYFIPHYFILGVIILKLINQNFSLRTKRWSYGIIIIALITGNFWIYPERTSQNWDSSLTHLPYYSLRENVKTYFEENNIDFSDVGYGYPNTSSIKYIEANNDLRKFDNIDFKQNTYIVYSNIQNLDDKKVPLIKQEYDLIKTFKKRGVFMSIYQRK